MNSKYTALVGVVIAALNWATCMVYLEEPTEDGDETVSGNQTTSGMP